MSILNSVNQLVTVKLYYKSVRTKSGVDKIIVLTDEEGEEGMKKQEDIIKEKQEKGEKITEEDRKIEVLTTQWKSLNWGDQTKIMKKSERFNPKGEQNIDWLSFRDLRIKNCLVNWDIKDAKGNPVPLSSETVDMLPSNVVAELFSKYIDLVEGTEEEQEKN